MIFWILIIFCSNKIKLYPGFRSRNNVETGSKKCTIANQSTGCLAWVYFINITDIGQQFDVLKQFLVVHYYSLTNLGCRKNNKNWQLLKPKAVCYCTVECSLIRFFTKLKTTTTTKATKSSCLPFLHHCVQFLQLISVFLLILQGQQSHWWQGAGPRTGACYHNQSRFEGI